MADTTRTTAGPLPQDMSAPVATDGQRTEHGTGRAVEDAKRIGNELAAAVRESAENMLDEQKRRAADQIATLGEALRGTSGSLDKAGPAVARYAEEAGRQIGEFAETVRTRSWSAIAGDIEDFARKWPAVYLAAAAGIGFIGGRVLLSPGPRPPAAGATSTVEPAAGIVPSGPVGTGSMPSAFGAATPARENG